MKKRICIFASGSGTNALNLIQYYKNGTVAEVVHVLTNNANAGVIAKAQAQNIPITVFSKKDLENGTLIDTLLTKINPDIIVLAGFLLKFPERLLHVFPKRIVNIHPALLPSYGGKGMYGDNVHKAVLANKETKHGVTVHLVNAEYDKGEILLQEAFELSEMDNLETVQAKIHAIEFRLFPKAIDILIGKMQ